MSGSDATATAEQERRVAFADLVRIHHGWRKAVDRGSQASAAEREAAEEAYHRALARFEDEHGEIISAYWCADVESAVALTAGKPSTGWLRRLLSVSPRFHRVSDWATKDEPEIARLLHECDALALRAAEVLRGRNRRICVQLVMTCACHLLSLVDARDVLSSPQARAAAIDAQGPAQQAQAENMLTGALRQLFALAEAYPDLKANQNFLALQEELTGTEGRIAFSRQFYNEQTLAYDNARESFPTNVVAGVFNFEPREYFEAEESSRGPVRVDFGQGGGTPTA